MLGLSLSMHSEIGAETLVSLNRRLGMELVTAWRRSAQRATLGRHIRRVGRQGRHARAPGGVRRTRAGSALLVVLRRGEPISVPCFREWASWRT